MDNGEIYKMTLDGKILGKFGTAGKLIKEFGSVHEMDFRSEPELSRFHVPGSRFHVHGSGTRTSNMNPEPGTPNEELGTRNMELHAT
jgi:hypothetical protein